MSKFTDHWQDMREAVDEALKCLGLLPTALNAMGHDPDFMDELVLKLSRNLASLDSYIGEQDEPSECWCCGAGLNPKVAPGEVAPGALEAAE